MIKQIQNIYKAIAILFAMFVSSLAVGDTVEGKGLDIFMEADARNRGYVDNSSEMLMILKDKHGNTRERAIRVRKLEGIKGESDKSLMIFDTPKDQKGTALLTYSYSDKDDDQWLWLPALKRIKKIASKNMSGPFMGSQFSFEDIGGIKVSEYNYKFIREEELNGLNCFVVESYPKNKHSGYTRIVSWIDQKHYGTIKSEFYDRKKILLKTLSAKDYHLYDDKHWRPDTLQMTNNRNGSSTTLRVKKSIFNVGLRASDFSKLSLKRAR